MTAANYQVQVKIDAETGGLVGEAKAANDAVGDLGKTAKRTGDQLEGMGKDGKKAEKSLRNQERQAKKTAKQYRAMGMAIKGAVVGMAAFVGMEIGGSIIHQADQFQLLDARIERLSNTSTAAARNYQELINISNRTGGDIGATIGLWESLTASLGELGYKQESINDLVGTLQKLGTIGGSSSEDMSNALRQLSQAFAGGVVRAEEYNSVMEGMPEIWRRVASAMGITLGELRQQMLAGQLTSEVVMEALESQAGDINREFEDMPRTVAQASNAIVNNLGKAISQIDEQIGATKYFAKFLDGIADDIAFAGAWYESFNQGTKDAEALKIQIADLNAELKVAKAVLKDQKANPVLAYLGTDDVKKTEAEVARLEAAIQQKRDLLLDVQGTSLTFNPDGTPKDQGKGKDNKPPKPPAPEKADKKGEAAADYLKQVQRRSFDEIAILEAQLEDELKLVDQYEKAKYYNKQQAQDARAALEADYANRIADVLTGEQAEADKVQGQLDQEKANQEKKFALFQQGYMDERALIDAERSAKLAQIDFWDQEEIGKAKERAALREQVEKEHKERLAALDAATAKVRIDAAQSMAGSLMSITGDLSGKQSNAYRAMFAVTKGMALAEGTINMWRAISQAAAMGWPQNIPLIAQATAQGAQIISTISSVALQGQAHDGITRVPQDGTWNLQKNERVYTNESANQLDRMYDRIMSGEAAQGAGFTIINVVDPKLVEEYLASPEGANAIINVISDNRTEVQQLMGA